MKNGKTLALFDFDGTITTKDTFMDFLVFSFGRKKVYKTAFQLLPSVLLYFFKQYSGKKLKEEFLIRLIKGWTEEKFDSEAEKYTRERLPAILKKSAIDTIRLHKERGDEIALVSASIDRWLKFFSKDNEMKLIATKLEIENGVFTGKIAGENCRGAEKVKRILEIYDLDGFEHIYAYGDTSGDKEMLLLADNKFLEYFK